MDNYEIKPADNGQPLTKQMIWERKLLDFSLRNNLINIHFGKRVLQLNIKPSELEDRIYDGETLQLDCENTACDTETELQTALKFIYRTSRTAMEENGANSLFLTLGTLQWYETPKNEKARLAPILLLPVEIIRKGGKIGYVIRGRDEDIILNITLIEFLKQQFKIDISNMNPLPKDEKGVDVPAVFETLRQHIASQQGWEVQENSMLGIFSFNKFVMWNDIHTNADKLKENVILASLMENRITWEDQTPDADARQADKTWEPAQFSIPLDVDSSQLEAVIESGEGKSFILHGPPGTGKSQTITNMIANALYRGKRVLFVAEKMAALHVVQKRLTRIGLDPFCLELHSNKVTKTHFLSQMQQALDAIHILPPEEYENISSQLFQRRQELIRYMEALHRPQANGYSLYDCITRYLSIDGEEMPVDASQFTSITREQTAGIREKLMELDTIFQISGHPSQHPLEGLEPLNATQESTRQLKDTLLQFRQQLQEHATLQHFTSQTTELLEKQPTDQPEWMNRLKTDNDTSWMLTDLNNQLQKEWERLQAKWFLPKFFGKRNFIKQYQQRQGNASQALNRTYTQLQGMAHIQLPEDGSVAAIISDIDRWLENLHSLRDWHQWCIRKHALEEQGLSPVIKHLIDNQLTAKQTTDAFFKGLYHQWAMQTVDSDESLRMFNGLIFEELIQKYKQLTADFQELTKKELYCRLASRIPSLTIEAAASSEMGILKRNITNGGRGTSIRKLIDQIPTLLPKLCPCMLMSPISVAQYIDLDTDKFDIVIFDEASQMPTSEAVGAIARGKSLIVVGDPKQMPPTSFFASVQVDEEEAQYDDLESILDDCIALSIPSRYLTWHYRSKHESLIAFSNSEYYEGKLHTFPSVDDRLSKVSLVKVDGTYDKGKSRCNQEEAEAIVHEIIRRLQSPEDAGKSIGVVSFSQVQQHLIEDILLEELGKHPDLEQKAFQCEEPIFVKNLENVQGDERDIILFSIGYGPDEEGRVSMNFGPLNNQGGERRLNVAVSRARYEMMIFSTLRAEQIDLRRSQAKGVEGLKKFLEFAEKGNRALPVIPNGSENEQSIVNHIAEELRRHNFEVDTWVGRSCFKIDLAVLHPQHPEQYLLGILCDGKNYYETKTTRDREIVQPNVLRSLDWNLMRIWSVDWFENKDKVIARILERLQQLLKGEEESEAETAAKPTMTFNVAQEKAVVQTNNREKEYQFAQLPKVKGNPTLDKALAQPSRIRKQLQDILEVEQPATHNLLCKRIAELWGIRVSPRLQAAVDDALIGSYIDMTDSDVQAYWRTKEASLDYPYYRTNSNRDVSDIPLIEIMNAVRYAVEQQVSIPQADLLRSATRLLGFARKGASIESQISRAIQKLISNGVLVVNDGIVTSSEK